MPKKPISRPLTAKQVRELLQDNNWTLDFELSRESSPAYKHPDGRILLVFENNRGRLGESREALLESISTAKQLKPVHLLRGRLPQGERFVAEVPTLIDELAMKLGIPRNALDKSEDSLDKVDAAVQRIGRRKCLEPGIFAPLVAYVGEVIKQETGGEWELHMAADGETLEPWIVDQHGRSYAPFAVVFGELYEVGKSVSIRGGVHGQIRAHQLGR